MALVINEDKIVPVEIDGIPCDEFRGVYYPQLPGYKWIVGKVTDITIRKKIVAEFIFDICKINNFIEEKSDNQFLPVDDLGLYISYKHFGVSFGEENPDLKDKIFRLFYSFKNKYLTSDHLRNSSFVEREGKRYKIISKIVREQGKAGGKNPLTYMLCIGERPAEEIEDASLDDDVENDLE